MWQWAESDLVVICWKIRIFAYWTTPQPIIITEADKLWFAEKFVSLLIEQHLGGKDKILVSRCDLLKNSYLCLLNNTSRTSSAWWRSVVICWKIRIFAYWTTPQRKQRKRKKRVVICWKIRIFAYWTTPLKSIGCDDVRLWFAEKFVSLLIEQHHISAFGVSSAQLWFAEKFVSLLIEQHRKR